MLYTYPTNMIIVDGKLHMKDGSSVEEYLKAWQEKHEHPNGTEVNVMCHEGANSLLLYAQLATCG